MPTASSSARTPRPATRAGGSKAAKPRTPLPRVDTVGSTGTSPPRTPIRAQDSAPVAMLGALGVSMDETMDEGTVAFLSLFRSLLPWRKRPEFLRSKRGQPNNSVSRRACRMNLLLLVKTEDLPTWGSCTVLAGGERRRSSTTLRDAVNLAYAPLDVDHIDCKRM